MIIFGGIAPHPPIVIPEIGGKRIKDCEKTQQALRELSLRLKAKEKSIDTIVVTTPHGAVSQVAVAVYTSRVFEGDFSTFNAPKVKMQFKGDTELAVAVVKDAASLALRTPETILDHGIMVPMYYPTEAGIKKPVLPIAIADIPLKDLFEFGRSLRNTAEKMNRNLAIIASADMSHRLTPDAPAGYNPSGQDFDARLVEVVKNYDVPGLLNFPADLADKAGQDALWSIAILWGALDGLPVKHELLSYEGPFGVGYMVAAFEPAN